MFIIHVDRHSEPIFILISNIISNTIPIISKFFFLFSVLRSKFFANNDRLHSRIKKMAHLFNKSAIFSRAIFLDCSDFRHLLRYYNLHQNNFCSYDDPHQYFRHHRLLVLPLHRALIHPSIHTVPFRIRNCPNLPRVCQILLHVFSFGVDFGTIL